MYHVVLANANHWFLCVPLVSPLSSLQVRVFEESKWIKSPLLVVALEAPALPLSAYPLLVRESILTGCTCTAIGTDILRAGPSGGPLLPFSVFHLL